MPSSRVTVKRPDPKTGEVRESVVPADYFKPRLPGVPKPRPPREDVWCPRWSGLDWLAIYDLRERELNYWLAHAHALTRGERRLLAGGATAVIRPLEQEWEKGEVFEVANSFLAEVLETKWLRGVGGPFDNDVRYRTTFRISDSRPFLLRQVPSSMSPPHTDEYGNPLPPSAEAIEHARIDGAYTSQAGLAVPDSAEEIDDRLRRRLHQEQSMAAARQQARLTVDQKKLRLEQRIEEARAKYRRRMVRYLERELKKFERRNEAA